MELTDEAIIYNNIKGTTVIPYNEITEVKFMLVILSYILPIVVFVICEIILGRNIAKKSNRENFYVPNRDKALEAKVYIRAYVIYSIIYVIGAVVLLIA